MVSLRLSAALLLCIVGFAWGRTCPEDNPDCVQDKFGIGEAYALTAVRGRKLLQTPRNVAARNVAPNLANRRSLLAPFCSDTDNSVDAVIACTNAVRSSPGSFSADYKCGSSWVGQYSGLGPLDKHPSLMQAAQRHAEDNARMGSLSHTGSDGSRVSDRVKNAGYSYGSVRENIAYGYLSAKSVVMGWMCSSGHRANIMSCDISDIGVGIAKGSDGRYYHAQDFGCPSGQSCGCSGGDGSVPQDTTTPTSGQDAGTTSDPGMTDPSTETPGSYDYPSTSDPGTSGSGSDQGGSYDPYGQQQGSHDPYGQQQGSHDPYGQQQGSQDHPFFKYFGGGSETPTGTGSGTGYGSDPGYGSESGSYQNPFEQYGGEQGSGGFFDSPGSSGYKTSDGSGSDGSTYNFWGGDSNTGGGDSGHQGWKWDSHSFWGK